MHANFQGAKARILGLLVSAAPATAFDLRHKENDGDHHTHGDREALDHIQVRQHRRVKDELPHESALCHAAPHHHVVGHPAAVVEVTRQEGGFVLNRK